MDNRIYGRELLFNELPKRLQDLVKSGELNLESSESYITKSGKKLCKRCRHEFILVRKGNAFVVSLVDIVEIV